MDFGARVVIQDSASGQWSGRRTDDLYDERSICTTNGSHWPTRSLEDYGSEASHVALVPGESGTVVDRRRARKAAQAASTSTMEAACDQSRRPRCWRLGRGALPVRGCSASASGYQHRRRRVLDTAGSSRRCERRGSRTAKKPLRVETRFGSRALLQAAAREDLLSADREHLGGRPGPGAGDRRRDAHFPRIAGRSFDRARFASRRERRSVCSSVVPPTEFGNSPKPRRICSARETDRAADHGFHGAKRWGYEQAWWPHPHRMMRAS